MCQKLDSDTQNGCDGHLPGLTINDPISEPIEDAQRLYPADNGDELLASASALQSAARYVERGTGAGAPGDGSGEAFSASAARLLEWGVENELIRPQAQYSFFERPPDGHGEEHEAWFDQASNRWFKATYPGRFGLAWGRDGSATAGEYLSRLTLQNAYFGDDIQLVALLNYRNRLRVLTSQPHIEGEAAKYADIQQWFSNLGFCRLNCDHRIAWYLRAINLLVADAHEGNVIRNKAGMLVPIDLNLTQPTGALLEWALSESHSFAARPKS